MLRRLVAYLLGTLRIEVNGSNLAYFLNLALDGDISFWRIERLPDRMRATLSIRDFRALRPIARASRSRIRILERSGMPFLAQRLKGRPGLVSGALACLLFVIWASSHIWIIQVKVTGPQYLDPRAVAAVAAEAGLKRGARKRQINLEQVRVHIAKRMPETSWVVLRVQGTRVVIEVVEKAVEKGLAEPPCINLVARKAGVIEQVIPFQGEPVVKRGHVVQPGDLLIECSFKYYGGGRPQVYPGTPLPPRDTTARTGLAQGVVKARISYQEYRELPLYREVPVPTGRKSTRWVLNWRQQAILEGGTKGQTFALAQETRKTYPPVLWRNWKPPVELVIVHSEEVTIQRDPIPLATAIDQAREEMKAQLRWVLGPADRVLSPLKVEVVEQGQEFAGIRLTVETLEEISVPNSP